MAIELNGKIVSNTEISPVVMRRPMTATCRVSLDPDQDLAARQPGGNHPEGNHTVRTPRIPVRASYHEPHCCFDAVTNGPVTRPLPSPLTVQSRLLLDGVSSAISLPRREPADVYEKQKTERVVNIKNTNHVVCIPAGNAPEPSHLPERLHGSPVQDTGRARPEGQTHSEETLTCQTQDCEHAPSH
ncbi:unnamed protein product [Pleuronectes platessa]|uniref:Uncharacterized protein n=1 Tax=Pleuronectes platessa TaxID=8262 RepID=A0A9N7U8L4_PLEPL|nr:unnamed protein product [Pleuronectes platessa]